MTSSSTSSPGALAAIASEPSSCCRGSQVLVRAWPESAGPARNERCLTARRRPRPDERRPRSVWSVVRTTPRQPARSESRAAICRAGAAPSDGGDLVRSGCPELAGRAALLSLGEAFRPSLLGWGVHGPPGRRSSNAASTVSGAPQRGHYTVRQPPSRATRPPQFETSPPRRAVRAPRAPPGRMVAQVGRSRRLGAARAASQIESPAPPRRRPGAPGPPRARTRHPGRCRTPGHDQASSCTTLSGRVPTRPNAADRRHRGRPSTYSARPRRPSLNSAGSTTSGVSPPAR